MSNEPLSIGSADYDLLPGVPLITFGVECELVLAFHESLLLPHIEPGGLTIAKELTHWQRRELNIAHESYVHLGRKDYMSWALRGRYADTWFHYLNRSKRDHFVRPDLKSYWTEPLLIGRDILHGITDIFVFEERDNKLDVFTRWCLMNDYSVPGYSRKRLVKKFRDRIRPGQEENWDSWGCELISPVLDTHSDAFGKISKVLSALAGDSNSLHGCQSTYLGGLHVHIGFPKSHWPEYLRLATLQHLAYIMLLFEPTISSLHPHHRRPYSDANNPHYDDLEPNRTFLDVGYYSDDENPDPERRPEEYWSNRLLWGGFENKKIQEPPKMVSPRKLRKKIWEDNQTISSLSDFVGHTKGFLVSWRKLINIMKDPERVETLEFRQHAGTVDPAEIQHWVTFILALVRASYIKATTPTPLVVLGRPVEREREEGAKYPRDSWAEAENEEDVEDLLSLLELNDEEKAYWWGRFVKYSERNISEEISHQERNKVWLREERIRLDRMRNGERVSGEFEVSDDGKTPSTEEEAPETEDLESEDEEDGEGGDGEGVQEEEEEEEEDADENQEQQEYEVEGYDQNPASQYPIATRKRPSDFEIEESPRKGQRRYRRRTTRYIPLSRLSSSQYR